MSVPILAVGFWQVPVSSEDVQVLEEVEALLKTSEGMSLRVRFTAGRASCNLKFWECRKA